MFITNKIIPHKIILSDLFATADEVIFAVAFLKNSGLQNIKSHVQAFASNRNKKMTFFIGTGFGETDPQSLLDLHNLIKAKPVNTLSLCTPDAGIFHPKIYVFKKGTDVTIIIGSSNLTEAGWLVNDEVSSINKMKVDSLEHKKLMEYFDNLHNLYYTKNIVNLIEKYRSQLKDFDLEFDFKPVFRFKRKDETIDGVDMLRLKRYYQLYKSSDWFIDPIDRETRYNNARTNLEILASNKNLTDLQFHDLFGPLVGHSGYKKLWHSGSIHRTTYKTLEHPESFRFLVRKIKSNLTKSVNDAFTESLNALKLLKESKQISGIGENILTEMMMTFNYYKFGNLNENPITVLWMLGREYKSPSSFKGQDYADYIGLITQIQKELKMKSLLEIDSFFNYVYWLEE